MTPDVDVMIEAEQWSAVQDLENLAKAAIGAVLAQTGQKIAEGSEVSLLFCGDSRMRELNKAWRGIDKPTNVLSFPAAEPDRLEQSLLLGDIAVAFETVERESRQEGKSLGDHVSHMVAHGFLHLLGYDHESATEADEMEEAEREALARMGIADPYADSVPAGEEDR